MSLFGNIKKKLFGASKKLFGASNMPMPGHTRKEEAAAIAVAGQSGRRKKLMEARVKAGQSQKVYPNKKQINTLSTGIAPSLESPYLADFLDGHPYSRFASSNVMVIVYDRTKDRLYVQFIKKRRWYEYSNVSIGEAKVVYNHASKGVFVWTYLRMPGSKTAHKKPFRKDVPPPSYLPLATP